MGSGYGHSAAPFANNDTATIAEGSASTVVNATETKWPTIRTIIAKIDFNFVDLFSTSLLTLPHAPRIFHDANLTETVILHNPDRRRRCRGHRHAFNHRDLRVNGCTPVAVDDTETLTEDASLTSIIVLNDDTDADGDSLTVSAISYSGTGTAAINSDNARIDYTPAANFNGTDTITYTVSDGTATDTGKLTVTVSAVNDAPVAVDDTQTLTEDAPLTNIVVLDDDTDADSDSLTVTAISYSGTGNATINGSATIDYTPAMDFSGSETITYTVSDGTSTDTGTLTITVTAVNDAPVATNDSESLTEDDSLTSITVLDDDTDADGDSLTVSAISYSGTGTAAINADNARIDYTPAANFNGTDTITYTVSDGTVTDTGTLTVTVTAANDAPTVVNDTASTDDNTTLSGILLLDDDSDSDGDTLTLTGMHKPDQRLRGTGRKYRHLYPDPKHGNLHRDTDLHRV